jgi:hypothetical protein
VVRPWETPTPKSVGATSFAVACGLADWPAKAIQADIGAGTATHQRMLSESDDAAFQYLEGHPKQIGVPGAEAATGELRNEFPDVLRQAAAAALARLHDGGSDAESTQAGQAVIAQFLSSHVAALAAAPDDKIRTWMSAQGAELTALRQRDSEVCASIATRGSDVAAAQLVPEASANSLVAVLKAIRAGLDHPVARPPPTQSDIQALVAAMRSRGASDATIQAALQTGLAGLTPDKQCDGAAQLYAAIGDDIPPDAAGRIASALVSAAAKVVVKPAP